VGRKIDAFPPHFQKWDEIYRPCRIGSATPDIYQNWCNQTVMESVWSNSKLSTESVGSRHELVANCVHIADADATKQFRRVGGVYCV